MISHSCSDIKPRIARKQCIAVRFPSDPAMSSSSCRQLSCPVRVLAIMLRHLSRVALAWMMVFSLAVGSQPFLQASEVAGSWYSWFFLAINLPVMTKFSSFDFLMTCPQNSAFRVLIVLKRRLSVSVAARLRTLLLVLRSVQSMSSNIRRRSRITAASRRACLLHLLSTSHCSMLGLTVHSVYQMSG